MPHSVQFTSNMVSQDCSMNSKGHCLGDVSLILVPLVQEHCQLEDELRLTLKSRRFRNKKSIISGYTSPLSSWKLSWGPWFWHGAPCSRPGPGRPPPPGRWPRWWGRRWRRPSRSSTLPSHSHRLSLSTSSWSSLPSYHSLSIFDA